jgi:Flp pilus assembly CpaE family ATPase
VVVDTTPVSTEVTAAVLDEAELALLVTTPEVPVPIHGRRLLNGLHSLLFPIDRVQVVLNHPRSRTGVTTAQAQEALGWPITWQIRNDHAAMRAVSLGSPVVLMEPHSRAATDTGKIVHYLVGEPSGQSRFSWRFWRGGR